VASDSKVTAKVPASTVRTKAATPYNAAHYSKNQAAASLTSTAVGPVTINESELIDEEEFMYKHIKTKAYCSLQTNLGNLNIELFSDQTPRTCHNFVQLAKKGYYKGVSFHRSIKNFMVKQHKHLITTSESPLTIYHSLDTRRRSNWNGSRW
jgi:peptidyl-prolyl cis-trans isomerase-like protein 2